MFFIRIDAEGTRNVVGFECGTRAEFDKRRGGDPLWVFVDGDSVRAGIKLPDFFLNPQGYSVTARQALKKKPKTS